MFLALWLGVPETLQDPRSPSSGIHLMHLTDVGCTDQVNLMGTGLNFHSGQSVWSGQLFGLVGWSGGSVLDTCVCDIHQRNCPNINHLLHLVDVLGASWFGQSGMSDQLIGFVTCSDG